MAAVAIVTLTDEQLQDLLERAAEKGAQRALAGAPRAPLTEWVTPAQAAPRFGVDEKTVRRWCESGRIRAERHGSRWRIDRAALPASQPGTPEEHGRAAVVAFRK